MDLFGLVRGGVGGVGGLVWVKIKAKVNMPGNTREKERRARMKSFFSRERERAVRCSASQQSSKRWATRAKSLARLILTAAFALSALMLSKQRSLLRNADTPSETNVPRNV